VAELAVVDEVDAEFLLAADDIGHGALELFVEDGLILPGDGAVMGGREQFLGARQAPHVRGQDTVSHCFLQLYKSKNRLPSARQRHHPLLCFYQKSLAVGKARRRCNAGCSRDDTLAAHSFVIIRLASGRLGGRQWAAR
jgi:hypothetical protein